LVGFCDSHKMRDENEMQKTLMRESDQAVLEEAFGDLLSRSVRMEADLLLAIESSN